MSKAEHTPGPWTRGKYGHVVDSSGKDVGFRSVMIICAGSGIAEAEKNTDLIAAAPELLAALQRCLDYGSMTGDESVADQARAAIAKATTGSEPA